MSDLQREFKLRALALIQELGLRDATLESLLSREMHREQYRAILVDARPRASGAYLEALEAMIAECDAQPKREPAYPEGRPHAMQIRAHGVGYQVPAGRGIFDEAIEKLREPGADEGER